MRYFRVFSMMAVVCAVVVSPALAETGQDRYSLSLAQADPAAVEPCAPRSPVRSQAEGGYLGVSDFFNVREANADVRQGQWELEVEGGWSTASDGTDDDTYMSPALKYGITDTMFVELEVLPMNMGDGGDQGNGDLGLKLFWQFLEENSSQPAMATWGEIRIPTGEGSSGVDATLSMAMTKTLLSSFRAHLQGYITTANGGRGGSDANRRDFRWGFGPGFDYQFNEMWLGVLNYVNRSSDENGRSNENILEVGAVCNLTPSQRLKAGLDIGLDGRDETDNMGLKVEWTLEW